MGSVVKYDIITSVDKTLQTRLQQGISKWCIDEQPFTGIHLDLGDKADWENGVVRFIVNGFYCNLSGPARIGLHYKKYQFNTYQYWLPDRLRVLPSYFYEVYLISHLEEYSLLKWEQEWLPVFESYLTLSQEDIRVKI